MLNLLIVYLEGNRRSWYFAQPFHNSFEGLKFFATKKKVYYLLCLEGGICSLSISHITLDKRPLTLFLTVIVYNFILRLPSFFFWALVYLMHVFKNEKETWLR